MASASRAALESLKESNYVKYVILRSERAVQFIQQVLQLLLGALEVSAELCSIPGLSIWINGSVCE